MMTPEECAARSAEAYDEGHRDGYAVGYDDGYAEGVAQAAAADATYDPYPDEPPPLHANPPAGPDYPLTDPWAPSDAERQPPGR